MPAYWINCYRTIHDPERVAAYAEIGGPVILAAGGRFLVRGLPAAAHESGVVERTTVIEFDDLDTALATYHSDDYQRALAVLGDAADRDLRIVDGAR